MSDEDYHLTIETLKTVAMILSRLDLSGAAGRMERADALGPILDPTLYRKAADGLRAHRALVDAGLGFKRAIVAEMGRGEG